MLLAVLCLLESSISDGLNVRYAPDTVEKLRFEINGDFICDLSVILFSMYEGGSRSPMKIRPDAPQQHTIDL